MIQAVSRRPLAAENQVRSQVSTCEICGGQSGTGTGSSQEFSSISIISPLGYSMLISTYTMFCSYCKILNGKALKNSYKKNTALWKWRVAFIRLISWTFLYLSHSKYFTSSLSHRLHRVSLSKKYNPFTSEQLLSPPNISDGTFLQEILTQLIL